VSPHIESSSSVLFSNSENTAFRITCHVFSEILLPYKKRTVPYLSAVFISRDPVCILAYSHCLLIGINRPLETDGTINYPSLTGAPPKKETFVEMIMILMMSGGGGSLGPCHIYSIVTPQSSGFLSEVLTYSKRFKVNTQPIRRVGVGAAEAFCVIHRENFIKWVWNTQLHGILDSLV
jgi:hypothetical protein